MNRNILTFIGIIAIIVIIIFAAFNIYFKYFFSFSSTDGTYRTNEELITYFYNHYSEFNKLNEDLLIYAERGLNRIDDNWTRPDDLTSIGIDNNKLNTFREIFKSLDIPRGISCDYDSISYITYTYGFSISGESTGYYYSILEPANFIRNNAEKIQKEPFQNLDSIKLPSSASYHLFIKLEKNWYIYNEYED